MNELLGYAVFIGLTLCLAMLDLGAFFNLLGFIGSATAGVMVSNG